MPLPPDLSKPAFSLFPEKADRVIANKCVTCPEPVGAFKDLSPEKSIALVECANHARIAYSVTQGKRKNYDNILPSLSLHGVLISYVLPRRVTAKMTV